MKKIDVKKLTDRKNPDDRKTELEKFKEALISDSF